MILLTGATGYVGGRLLKALESQGKPVRCLVRDAARLQHKIGSNTQLIEGDALNADALSEALSGVTCVYYLIHSMGAGKAFEKRDRLAAQLLAEMAYDKRVGRIVYLGALGSGKNLSPHLRSRQEVGKILRESGVPTIEFRASIVLGSGSLSFELIRSLVEELPIMVTPKWVMSQAQPIAIEDVTQYLVQASQIPLQQSVIYEIGGPDRVSYLDLMKEYARQRGLTRRFIKVPLLSPRISALWLGLVTPVYARIGRKLIESVKHATVVEEDSALRDFTVEPRGYQEAIRRALTNEDREFALTHWSDAVSSAKSPRAYGGDMFGRRIVDSRTIETHHAPERVFAAVRRIGGDTGWYYGNFLWRLRGALDLIAGGVGMRRGRRHPDHLAPGDVLDFWRVEDYEPNKRLRLSAEMKVPGRAWLQFEVKPNQGGCELRQTAIFDPRGLLGLAYWYALYPLHRLVFVGMLNGIIHAAGPEGVDSKPTRMRSLLGPAVVLAGFVLLVTCAAALGGYFTSLGREGWYATLNKPEWNPPNWIFGPVWSTLYLMMAIAAWRVWLKRGFKESSAAMIAFVIQLALNAAWSGLFFGLRNPEWAFYELLAMAVMIVITIGLFARHSKLAAGLLLPYLAWVSFAGYLNFTIWQMNRGG